MDRNEKQNSYQNMPRSRGKGPVGKGRQDGRLVTALLAAVCVLLVVAVVLGIAWQKAENGSRQDVEALQENRKTLESEKTALEEDKAALESENAALEGEKAVLESDKAALESENAALESENAVLAGENAALESENAVLESENAELEQAASGLREETAGDGTPGGQTDETTVNPGMEQNLEAAIRDCLGDSGAQRAAWKLVPLGTRKDTVIYAGTEGAAAEGMPETSGFYADAESPVTVGALGNLFLLGDVYSCFTEGPGVFNYEDTDNDTVRRSLETMMGRNMEGSLSVAEILERAGGVDILNQYCLDCEFSNTVFETSGETFTCQTALSDGTDFFIHLYQSEASRLGIKEEYLPKLREILSMEAAASENGLVTRTRELLKVDAESGSVFWAGDTAGDSAQLILLADWNDGSGYVFSIFVEGGAEAVNWQALGETVYREMKQDSEAML